MTIIVAKKEKNKIHLASDNQTTWGDSKLETKNENTNRSKVEKISDDFWIWCSWSVQEITIFHRFCQRTKPKWDTENDIFDFMCEFKDFCEKRIKNFEFNSMYIIVYKWKIFTANWWYNIQEKVKYATAGSWMFCASVAIDMWASAKEAVAMAIKHDLYCGGEVHEIEIEIS